MDSLVLNIDFDGHDDTPRKTAVVKGGRWTDRLKAKREHKRKPERQEPLQEELIRPTKKSRKDPVTTNDDGGEPSTSTSSAPQPQQQRNFISSLFTSNPEIKGVPQATARKASKPSNAPLADQSSFEALGLNALISTHLSTRMNISTPTSIQREVLPPLLSTSEDLERQDVFISSQTGSGKTLSFLLPIVQDLFSLSSMSYVDRTIGTLAIIISPTRELAKQTSDVLESLLKMRLRPQEEGADTDHTETGRLTRWLVSGLLTGGATRNHEKARLRKGLPIVVATPGRLLDHLENTSSLNVAKCRWLVLDEADRLMDLGFEESIKKILSALDGRRQVAVQAIKSGKGAEAVGWDWEKRRRTVLCSATIREDVQQLAGTALVRPIVIKSAEVDSTDPTTTVSTTESSSPSKPAEKFTPPSQLLQKYTIVPLKLRLVTLVSLLRTLLSRAQTGKHSTKIIVFFSCTDSVDFHWHLIGGSSMMDGQQSDSEDDERGEASNEDRIALKSALLPDALIYRLHGSLPHTTRSSSLQQFSNPKSPSSSILFCTSVASRGLDLPLIRAVVQYDLPTESGVTEYVHRVGRTARVGKGGEAWSFVAPSEKEWVKWIEAAMQNDEKGKKKVTLEGVPYEGLLKSGLGGDKDEFEDRATDVQLSFERWALKDKKNGALARKAFQSHMRAYATHPANEKHMFHLRLLHTGHVAKSFALRDAPTAVSSKSKLKAPPKASPRSGTVKKHRESQAVPVGVGGDRDTGAENRMREVVRAQGKLTKMHGKMVISDTSEFQIAVTDELERLVKLK